MNHYSVKDLCEASAAGALSGDVWAKAMSSGKLSPCGSFVSVQDSIQGMKPVELPKPGPVREMVDPQTGAAVQVALLYAKWPLWFKLVAQTRLASDAGIGDTIAGTIGPVGGDAYKKWFKKLTGKDCGCTARQESLNQVYPYTAITEDKK